MTDLFTPLAGEVLVSHVPGKSPEDLLEAVRPQIQRIDGELAAAYVPWNRIVAEEYTMSRLISNVIGVRMHRAPPATFDEYVMAIADEYEVAARCAISDFRQQQRPS